MNISSFWKRILKQCNMSIRWRIRFKRFRHNMRSWRRSNVCWGNLKSRTSWGSRYSYSIRFMGKFHLTRLKSLSSNSVGRTVRRVKMMTRKTKPVLWTCLISKFKYKITTQKPLRKNKNTPTCSVKLSLTHFLMLSHEWATNSNRLSILLNSW